jgi:hypothetical protein
MAFSESYRQWRYTRRNPDNDAVHYGRRVCRFWRHVVMPSHRLYPDDELGIAVFVALLNVYLFKCGCKQSSCTVSHSWRVHKKLVCLVYIYIHSSVLFLAIVIVCWGIRTGFAKQTTNNWKADHLLASYNEYSALTAQYYFSTSSVNNNGRKHIGYAFCMSNNALNSELNSSHNQTILQFARCNFGS